MGAAAERTLAGRVFPSGIAMFGNPGKAKDKYTHDAFIVFQADIKTVRTRFYKAGELHGIPPVSAVTLNVKDVERYKSLYPSIHIVFDIDYPAEDTFPAFKSVRLASLTLILKYIEKGKAKLHTYYQRADDASGNGKASYVLDAAWLREI